MAPGRLVFLRRCASWHAPLPQQSFVYTGATWTDCRGPGALQGGRWQKAPQHGKWTPWEHHLQKQFGMFQGVMIMISCLMYVFPLLARKKEGLLKQNVWVGHLQQIQGLLQNQGSFATSKGLHMEAVKSSSEILGEEHPDTLKYRYFAKRFALEFLLWAFLPLNSTDLCCTLRPLVPFV